VSTLDVFVRNASTDDRLYVIDSGLLTLIADEMFSTGFHKCGDLQIYFDFLSEAVRFDEQVLRRLETVIVERGVDFFTSLLLENLVDSNVFIRSLVLTTHQCHLRSRSSGASSEPELTTAGALVCFFVRSTKKQKKQTPTTIHCLPIECGCL